MLAVPRIFLVCTSPSSCMYHGLLGFAIISTLPKPRMIVVDLILANYICLQTPVDVAHALVAHNIGDAMED